MPTNLVTASEYKEYKGITSTSQDDQLDVIIPAVSAMVKTICRQSFVDYTVTSKEMIFDGGTDKFILEESPIIAVSSVEFSDDYGQNYVTLTQYTDYVVVPAQSAIKSISPSFNYALNGYRVTYTAGYETLPIDLKLAVFDLITYYLKNESQVNSTMGATAGSLQIEYIKSTSLPIHIRRVLDLYTDRY
jgi:hypothetical protein